MVNTTKTDFPIVLSIRISRKMAKLLKLYALKAQRRPSDVARMLLEASLRDNLPKV